MADGSAFVDEFTKARGHAFLVAVDPVFHDQIGEAASFVARSKPDNQRQPYVSDLVNAARTAAPPPPPKDETAEEEDDDDEKRVEPESPQVTEAKRVVVTDLVRSIEGIRLDSVADRDFEGFLNLALSLVLDAFPSSSSEFHSLVQSLAGAAAHNEGRTIAPTTNARYSALATILNTLPHDASSTKLAVLRTLVAFADKNDDLAVLAPIVAALPQRLDDWGYALASDAEDEGNSLVASLATTLASRHRARQALSLVLARLAPSTSSSSTPSPPSRSELVSHAIRLTLSQPDAFDLQVLSSLPPPSDESLVELQRIFTSGDVATFDSFASSHQSLFEGERALDRTTLERKLRLLALTELASSRVGQAVPYADIASTLGVSLGEGNDGEEIETWVIDAIRASLVAGRLSQPQSAFLVTRAAPRSFGPEHWQQLQAKLEAWRTSLTGILDTVGNNIGSGSLAPGAEQLMAAGNIVDDEQSQGDDDEGTVEDNVDSQEPDAEDEKEATADVSS